MSPQQNARAAGFYIQEQSVSAQGAANAGAGVQSQDASVLFFNPAAMTALDGASVVAGASVISPGSDFSNRGSTAGLTGAPAPYAASDGGNPYDPAVVPNFYVAVPLQQGRYWLGLALTSPFGLSNDYDRDWFGRYDSTKSDLRTLNISPSAALRVTDSLALGGGVNIQHAKVTLESALPCPTPFAGCGAAFSPASDGTSRLEGDDWQAGFNLGALWTPNDKTRLGFQYRSAMTQVIEGTTSVSGLNGALAAQNGSRAATAKLKLPDVIGFSLSHRANSQLTWLGSANWFGWRNFNEIRVSFKNGSPDSVTPENYRNSVSAALGAEWKQSERLTLRSGIQYDMTPTTDIDRSTRTPDSDRYWLSLGARYAVSKNFSIDAAATHVFMKDSDINLTRHIYAGTALDSTVDINGASHSRVDIAALQVVWHF